MLSNRMDTGQSYISLRDELSKLPSISSFKDLCKIIDEYVGREGSWHTGSNPVQSILSCLYMEDLLTFYIGTSEGTFLVEVLQSELTKRLSAARNGIQPSRYPLTKDESGSSDEQKSAKPSTESFSKGQDVNLFLRDLETDALVQTDTKNQVRQFLESLPLYEFLTMVYFVGAIKTVDSCCKHYDLAKKFIFAGEDIGLNTFDFNFLCEVNASKIRMLLMASCQLLELEIKEVEQAEKQKASTAAKPSNKNTKKGSKSKSKSKQPSHAPEKKQPEAVTQLQHLISRFKVRSEVIYILDELPTLPDAARFDGVVQLLDEILRDLPSSKVSLKPQTAETHKDYSVSNPIEVINPVFSGGIQSRANNNMPRHFLSTLSSTDGYTTWKSIILTINTYHSLVAMGASTQYPTAANLPGSGIQPKTSGNLRAFFVSFGGNKPTLPISSGPDAGKPTAALPIARAVLHNVTFNVMDGTILGDSVVEWVLRDFKEISGAPYLRTVLNNSYIPKDKQEDTSELEAVKNLRPSIDDFLSDASVAYVELLFSFVCNRSRQRQMLSHSIVIWDSLEVSAHQLDTLIHNALEEAKEPLNTYSVQQQIPSQMASLTGISAPLVDVRQAFPIMWWTSTRRMLTILWVILMGFELEVYKPWEYGYMYDYAESVEKEISALLDIIKLYQADALAQRSTKENSTKTQGDATFVDKSKMVMPSEEDYSKYRVPKGSYYLRGDPKTVFIDMNVADQYVYSIQYEQHIMKQLCEAQRKLSEAAIMLGYVVRPESVTKHTPAKLLYKLRMKPFSSVGYPAPPVLDFGDEKDVESEPKKVVLKDSQRGLYQLRPDDLEIATPARVTRRLKLAKSQGQALQAQLNKMVPPTLLAAVSHLISSYTDPAPSSKAGSLTLSSTNPTLLSAIDCVGTTAAASQLVRIKNTADKIQQSADRLEKHLKNVGGFKNRKPFKTEIVTDGLHPWFPVMSFERK